MFWLGHIINLDGVLSKSCGHSSSLVVLTRANCVMTRFVNGSIRQCKVVRQDDIALLRLCLIASLASTQFCTVKIQFNWISILF